MLQLHLSPLTKTLIILHAPSIPKMRTTSLLLLTLAAVFTPIHAAPLTSAPCDHYPQWCQPLIHTTRAIDFLVTGGYAGGGIDSGGIVRTVERALSTHVDAVPTPVGELHQ